MFIVTIVIIFHLILVLDEIKSSTFIQQCCSNIINYNLIYIYIYIIIYI